MLEPGQWKALDAYAPAAVDALLAVAARSGDSVMLEAARASGLVGESLEDSETGTAVPRRIRAVWRLLCANPQHRAIADDWLARALVESPGAVVRLLLEVGASDWTTLAAAVLAAGVDPWMPLPGDETRVRWGDLPGVALESPSIVALAVAEGEGLAVALGVGLEVWLPQAATARVRSAMVIQFNPARCMWILPT